VPNHQRSSAPQLAPTEMTTMDLHMRRCLPFEKAMPLGARGRSYAPPVAEKRRHHQPQERRFHGGMPSPQSIVFQTSSPGTTKGRRKSWQRRRGRALTAVSH
jgi:hypothetical protein